MPCCLSLIVLQDVTGCLLSLVTLAVKGGGGQQQATPILTVSFQSTDRTVHHSCLCGATLKSGAALKSVWGNSEVCVGQL